jgi:hypothetical protein
MGSGAFLIYRSAYHMWHPYLENKLRGDPGLNPHGDAGLLTAKYDSPVFLLIEDKMLTSDIVSDIKKYNFIKIIFILKNGIAMTHYIVCSKKRNSPRLNVRICQQKCVLKENCKEYLSYLRSPLNGKSPSATEDHCQVSSVSP